MKLLVKTLRKFTADRDWDQFHSPKNLVMALSVEVAEIAEHFQWMDCDESRSLPAAKREAVREEIGDALIYLVVLADKLGIDPLDAARRKLRVNAKKYPARKVRGKSAKYTEYE
ncbi:MAG: nucleotide pyrophosphohydrolase [Deltaproteobacteria bacterium]|nr:nucleotide pyrophosphohydrolase [Deltaproteobacteria bacterium]